MQTSKATTARANKTIRLATDLEQALKEHAYQRTRQTGRRVSESDLIDEALRQFLANQEDKATPSRGEDAVFDEIQKSGDKESRKPVNTPNSEAIVRMEIVHRFSNGPDAALDA